jgi:hypothetical protein
MRSTGVHFTTSSGYWRRRACKWAGDLGMIRPQPRSQTRPDQVISMGDRQCRQQRGLFIVQLSILVEEVLIVGGQKLVEILVAVFVFDLGVA